MDIYTTMAHTLQAEKNESSSEDYVSPIHLAKQPVALKERWVHFFKKSVVSKNNKPNKCNQAK